ncbi:MAG: DoxX family membrane protein [Bacteroidales bacterium]|nr:DoxX family membrane protein [Bacteroidales bacterium]MCF8396526.1 DoxX family membrane protein [Bacteroidales bacterium]
MNLRGETFHKIDLAVTRWMAASGFRLLRWSIGLIFLWFGGLKFFQGMSPAEELAIQTIQDLSFGLISEQLIIYGLAVWEVLIGIGLLFNIFMRETLLLLFLQMIGTFSPVFLYPEKVFAIFPYALTLEGQYIIKNLVIVSAGIVLGATVRGGRFETNEKQAQKDK